MTKVLFGAVLVAGCATAAAGVVFATPKPTPEPVPAIPASSASCPAPTGE
ncbi:hypothetical protein [Nonomuraea harbinensis]|uniref:Lipoprotein n=1 Tax=Nonomuraea harbinensis TaxID=1286938 RepID=A0ABW1BQP8_9ACTN|nr:hypothetical protein [Nonomuraea harbinensis]